MTSAEELDLVKKAILLGRIITGCCEWHERGLKRVQTDAELAGLTPTAIRELAIEFVLGGGIIGQVKEKRPEYDEYEFYYKVVVPVPEFSPGLFVEMRLVDPDTDCPTVLLVNAHAQRK